MISAAVHVGLRIVAYNEQYRWHGKTGIVDSVDARFFGCWVRFDRGSFPDTPRDDGALHYIRFEELEEAR